MELLMSRSEAILGNCRKKRNGRGVIAGVDSESLREMSEKLKLHLNKSTASIKYLLERSYLYILRK